MHAGRPRRHASMSVDACPQLGGPRRPLILCVCAWCRCRVQFVCMVASSSEPPSKRCSRPWGSQPPSIRAQPRRIFAVGSRGACGGWGEERGLALGIAAEPARAGRAGACALARSPRALPLTLVLCLGLFHTRRQALRSTDQRLLRWWDLGEHRPSVLGSDRTCDKVHGFSARLEISPIDVFHVDFVLSRCAPI